MERFKPDNFNDWRLLLTDLSKGAYIGLHSYYLLKGHASWYYTGICSLVDLPKKKNESLKNKELNKINSDFVQEIIDSNWEEALILFNEFMNHKLVRKCLKEKN